MNNFNNDFNKLSNRIAELEDRLDEMSNQIISLSSGTDVQQGLGSNFNLIEYSNLLNFSPETNIPLGKISKLTTNEIAEIYVIFNVYANMNIDLSLVYNNTIYSGMYIHQRDEYLTGFIYAKVPITETNDFLWLSVADPNLYGEINNVKVLLSKDFLLEKDVFV